MWILDQFFTVHYSVNPSLGPLIEIRQVINLVMFSLIAMAQEIDLSILQSYQKVYKV